MTIAKYINNLWWMINRIDAAKAIEKRYNCKLSDELTDEIKHSIDCIFDYEVSRENRRLNPVKIEVM